MFDGGEGERSYWTFADPDKQNNINRQTYITKRATFTKIPHFLFEDILRTQ